MSLSDACAGADGGVKDPKASQHYEWAAEINKRGEELQRLGVSTAPQKLVNEATPKSEEVRSQSSGSAWNTAGTWEDRDVSKWAARELKQRLKNLRITVNVDGIGECHVRLPKIPRCTGNATVAYVRNKARPGFEYDLKARWEVVRGRASAPSTSSTVEDNAEASDSGNESDQTVDVLATGHVHFPDLADDCIRDFEWAIDIKKATGNESMYMDCVRSNRSQFEALFAGWVEDMREQ